MPTSGVGPALDHKEADMVLRVVGRSVTNPRKGKTAAAHREPGADRREDAPRARTTAPRTPCAPPPGVGLRGNSRKQDGGPRGAVPQGGRSTSPPEAQSISLHSENERQCFSTTFPMGQRPKNAFHKTSSYLLRQLIHRYRRLDAEEVEDEIEDEDEDVVGDGDGDEDEDEDEDQKQAEVESEESSESEMLNLEVCHPPAPRTLDVSSSRRAC
nr:bromodomain adjacent to zinc finger domain protein 2B-like [Loxodonta africana]